MRVRRSTFGMVCAALAMVCGAARAGDLDSDLMKATRRGTPESVEALIAAGANVNAKDRALGWTPLHIAAMYRCLDNMQKLLQHGADVNATDKKGNTPLISAVDSLIVSSDGLPIDPDLDMIAMLLAKHPDLEAHNAAGRTALMVAMEDHRVQVIEMLRKAGATETDSAGSEFIGDVRAHDLRAVQAMLVKGVKPDTADRSGRTGLMIAADAGADDVAAALLEQHANVNAVDSDGNTPIMYAVRRGREELVRRLLDSGADTSVARRASGETVVHLAAAEKNPAILRMLLEKGARVNTADRRGLTPLMRAAMGGSLEFSLNTTGRIALPINVKLLLDHGADVNAEDGGHSTALTYALEVRANPVFPSGATPDDIAKIGAAYAEVVQLLRSAGGH